MTKVRWGVLSTAGIAQTELIPAFKRSSNAEVVAIASGSGLEKVKAVANDFNIEKTYDSYENLLEDPDIDAVYIPLPNHLHKKWVIETAKRGKHILCEKPAALHAEEVLEMQKSCKENNVLFMEAFMYQFHPQHERVCEIIDAGEIGEVRYMQSGFSFLIDEKEKASNIRMTYEQGGGSIYDIGCYSIHATRNILRVEPTLVHAQAVIDPKYQVDTDAVIHLTFSNGTRATIDSSFSLAFRDEYRVFGTEGSITVPRAYRPDLHGGEGLIIVEAAGAHRIETFNGDQYRLQVEHISDAILNAHVDQDRMQTIENTIHNMRVIDACYESIQSGKQVKI